MSQIFDLIHDKKILSFSSGDILFLEGGQSDHIYIHKSGRLEVIKGSNTITFISAPGSIIGEMSFLLNIPHTATVKAVGACEAYKIHIDDVVFKKSPELSWHVAKLLAKRLNAATTYVADVFEQFKDNDSHIGMIPEILDALINQDQTDYSPGSDREDYKYE